MANTYITINYDSNPSYMIRGTINTSGSCCGSSSNELHFSLAFNNRLIIVVVPGLPGNFFKSLFTSGVALVCQNKMQHLKLRIK
uniref:Uncharacterized protein n=1 Tax=Glossina brevipalpis TaxID=37001 RepID=A0A1A9WII5_9MUSC